jgi:hypothetical protein
MLEKLKNSKFKFSSMLFEKNIGKFETSKLKTILLNKFIFLYPI